MLVPDDSKLSGKGKDSGGGEGDHGKGVGSLEKLDEGSPADRFWKPAGVANKSPLVEELLAGIDCPRNDELEGM